MEFFLQLLLNGIVVGSIYSLVGLGFVVIYKSTSVLNFAQGEFLVLGAYVCLTLTVQYHVPFFWSFLLTLVFSALMGILTERIILRPMIGEPVISLIMVTLGLSSLLKAVIQGIWGTELRPFPDIFPADSRSRRTSSVVWMRVILPSWNLMVVSMSTAPASP